VPGGGSIDVNGRGDVVDYGRVFAERCERNPGYEGDYRSVSEYWRDECALSGNGLRGTTDALACGLTLLGL